MGHDSMRAALINQFATIDAPRRIAEVMGTQRAPFLPDSFGDGGDGDDASGPLEPTA